MNKPEIVVTLGTQYTEQKQTNQKPTGQKMGVNPGACEK
jgi:hypothetical protein